MNGKQPLVLGQGGQRLCLSHSKLQALWNGNLQEVTQPPPGEKHPAAGREGMGEKERQEWWTGALVYSSGLCLTLEPAHI